jgi:hypothetical protein
MSGISTIILPEYDNRVSNEEIRKYLDLVESIIGFSKGKCLTKEDKEDPVYYLDGVLISKICNQL